MLKDTPSNFMNDRISALVALRRTLDTFLRVTIEDTMCKRLESCLASFRSQYQGLGRVKLSRTSTPPDLGSA